MNSTTSGIIIFVVVLIVGLIWHDSRKKRTPLDSKEFSSDEHV